jgi:hypothetical protein
MYSLRDSVGREFCFLIPDPVPEWVGAAPEDDPDRIEVYEKISADADGHRFVEMIFLGKAPTTEVLESEAKKWLESQA